MEHRSFHFLGILFVAGQAGGEAIAAALLGEYSPSGRIAYTIYASDFSAQRPDPTNHWLDSPPFGLTYMYWRGTPPLFGFGTGLTFASIQHTFSADTQLVATVSDDDESLSVGMDVWRDASDSFEGDTAKFSVLLFASYTGHNRDQISSQPLKKLVAFDKVELARGEKQTVALEVSLMRGLAAVTDEGSYALQAGEYLLTSPGASVGEEQQARLTLRGGESGFLREDRFLPEARARAAAQAA